VGLGPERFVVCTQNHDQVGNRATGERTAALLSEGRLHIAAALLLTSPFVPMLFQGEEWAASTPFQYFTDHADPDLGAAVSDGRRSEFTAFGWAPEDVPDPQALATFERSRLDWAELSDPEHSRLLDWYRTLIALRRRHLEITDPGTPTHASLDDGLLRVDRGSVHVVAAIGSADRSFDLGPEAEVLAAWPAGTGSDGAAGLPIDSVVVWRSPGG
jgi:maltooligosyltrehalose trehalohydrolase